MQSEATGASKWPDKSAFNDAVDEALEAILTDPLYEIAKTYGTLAITGLAQALGFLPTRNFQESTFAGAEKLRGEVFFKQLRNQTQRMLQLPGCVQPIL